MTETSAFIGEYAEHRARHGEPDRIELLLCDINAILRGKWLPGAEAEKLAEGGTRLPLSTYAPNILGREVPATGLGIVAGDPDGRLVPIPGTLKPVPWAKGNAAQVLVEMAGEDGEISQLSPRQRLARTLSRFSERGLTPVVATELEFYLLRARGGAEDPPRPPERSPPAQNYDLETLDRTEAVLSDIVAAAEAQDLPIGALVAEYGPGQFEINFRHSDDALAAADAALLFRRLVRGVVGNHGLEATFMAKPYAEHPGSGMHVHASIVDSDGRNIFDGGRHGPTAPAPSAELGKAVAGALATMSEMQAVFAPHLNSYRRFAHGGFAPDSPDWGADHRAAAVRLPETAGPAARLEHRICGADVNPHLAVAAILAGMLLGLDEAPPLKPALAPDGSNRSAPLGHDWTTAVRTFAASEFAADAFGREYRDIYAAVRLDEIAEIASIIPPAEYRYYLSRL